jgi:phosphatidylserine/phosphatidylglycerophosphate/cardiolipin synthase-like enzyme
MDNERRTVRMRKKLFCRALPLLFFLLIFAVGFIQVRKPLPRGLSFAGEVYPVPVGNITFLRDLTYRGEGDVMIHDQEIFDAIFFSIDRAERYVLLDMFLFNSYISGEFEPLSNLAEELTLRLVEKKKAVPKIRIDVITDPINTVYRGHRSAQIEALRAAGINVILTDLKRLRDSNPGYSSFWRVFVQWFGNSDRGGILPHPFSRAGAGVTLRSYLDMLNFKANHRKVFIADRGDSFVTIVSSANPHDGSSAHSNVALQITGDLWRDAYGAEEAVARLSGADLGPRPRGGDDAAPAGVGDRAEVVLLTESRIKEEVLALLAESGEGDRLWMAMFYLSDRDVVRSLLGAARRGSRVRLILDPNRDAFGYEKNGIPNRQVARELIEQSGGGVEVRWYDTHGEQFHSKLVFLEREGEEATVILGSANLTRRNLENYNLELDVRVTAGGSLPPVADVRLYLERLWENRGGRFTVDFETFDDSSALKVLVYRLQEFTGLCSF